jgi:hypothetical protein
VFIPEELESHFSQVFILKAFKVVCFDTDLERLKFEAEIRERTPSKIGVIEFEWGDLHFQS